MSQESFEKLSDSCVEASSEVHEVGELDVEVSTLDGAKVAGREMACLRELCACQALFLPALPDSVSQFDLNSSRHPTTRKASARGGDPG